MYIGEAFGFALVHTVRITIVNNRTDEFLCMCMKHRTKYMINKHACKRTKRDGESSTRVDCIYVYGVFRVYFAFLCYSLSFFFSFSSLFLLVFVRF